MLHGLRGISHFFLFFLFFIDGTTQFGSAYSIRFATMPTGDMKPHSICCSHASRFAIWSKIMNLFGGHIISSSSG
jgi:hypothetical protein